MSSLRNWFIAHFVVDMLVALPLFFAPSFVLGLIGFVDAPTILARIIAAALFGIGGVSLLVRDESREVFRALLKLKLIWSGFAIASLCIALIQGGGDVLVLSLITGVFFLFFLVWGYYLKKV